MISIKDILFNNKIFKWKIDNDEYHFISIYYVSKTDVENNNKLFEGWNIVSRPSIKERMVFDNIDLAIKEFESQVDQVKKA